MPLVTSSTRARTTSGRTAALQPTPDPKKGRAGKVLLVLGLAAAGAAAGYIAWQKTRPVEDPWAPPADFARAHYPASASSEDDSSTVSDTVGSADAGDVASALKGDDRSSDTAPKEVKVDSDPDQRPRLPRTTRSVATTAATPESRLGTLTAEHSVHGAATPSFDGGRRAVVCCGTRHAPAAGSRGRERSRGAVRAACEPSRLRRRPHRAAHRPRADALGAAAVDPGLAGAWVRVSHGAPHCGGVGARTHSGRRHRSGGNARNSGRRHRSAGSGKNSARQRRDSERSPRGTAAGRRRPHPAHVRGRACPSAPTGAWTPQ